MRRGRYRFEMIKKESLQLWADPLARIFQTLKNDQQANQIEEWEFVSFYVLVFVFLNCPNEKWTSQNKLVGQLQTAFDLERLNYFVDTGLSAFNDILNDHQKNQWKHCCRWLYGDMKTLRGVPESVLKSLREWRKGHYRLFQLFHIPSAQELLYDQIQGKRCVTTLIERDQIPEPAETGRDVWSFCMHDLLHASHFFGTPEHLPAQRYLASFFLKAWKKSFLQDLLMADSVLLKEFTYVAADMNAHPVYLVMSFYTTMRDHFKRHHLGAKTDRMSSDQEATWRELWFSLLSEISPQKELLNTWGQLVELDGSNRSLLLKQIETFFLNEKNVELLI